jgi:hypothetical protein
MNSNNVTVRRGKFLGEKSVFVYVDGGEAGRCYRSNGLWIALGYAGNSDACLGAFDLHEAVDAVSRFDVGEWSRDRDQGMKEFWQGVA